ncbi:MAG: cyclic nucleotide-binding domain-containing protein [Anaerolineae bacterium]|nr:cyclic nucleotide-binding domain-containing protein [Anaerolineae bacterium]
MGLATSASPAHTATPHADKRRSGFIELRDLVKVYKTPAGEFTALKSLNVEVGKGEFIAVIGKSGSGKSTFINMITGIDRPTSGEVWIGGTAIHNLNETQMAKWRGKNLGIVFQFFQLLPTLTLLENIVLAMELNGQHDKKTRRERAMQLLELVEMAEQANKLPSAVSGGQQQRVAIARALANDPPLIVADEPTGSLDSKTADKIFLLFEKLVASGKTILVVTHDNNQVKRANRTIVISDGEIVNEYLVQALAALTQDQLVEVKRKVKPLIYPAGSTIVRQGETGDKFYIITQGQVDVLIDRPDGSQVLVNQLHEGQYFGEMALLGSGLRTATVRASIDSEVGVVALDSAAFNALIAESHSLRDELSIIIQQRQMIEQVQLISTIPEGKLLALTQHLASETYAPNATVIRQGTIGDSFYIIVEGEADVVQDQPDGSQKVINHLRRGQYFGELALLGNKRRTASVRAAASGTLKVVTLSKEEFDTLVQTSDSFRQHVEEVQRTRK